ncbi:MAG TPA: ammonia-forming cytochrome c nitrite reductase subunit c552 [Candidatus Binatia bacterium]|nr:ammonia-forming cytochrome c nitrite reductase subunit c552 [Candidatus Binatia bacterium]
MHDGVTSTFFRNGEALIVRTDGSDGQLHDYTVAYTFGVAPLQQYLIGFPDGRYQALGIAWDARPRAAGGRRWFDLYPDERFRPGDPLHWTGRLQNWNHMCAECHSTGVEKNYNPAARSYHTTWKEIDVSCEACHGPGSRHVTWAERHAGGDSSKGLAVLFDERRGVRWPIDGLSGNARRSIARTTDKEIETCARCHSRRTELFEDYRWGRPLMDTHLPALLEEGLYHADGQIEGEVYEYGSFLQSRMQQRGVTCSDCHEPHGLTLRAPGDGVCLQCHLSIKYATAQHHFHRPGSAGSACVDCHMPATTYMIVDPRRDHSFRIPRPDLSARLGTPNACTGCHRDESAQWAASRIRDWYGHEPHGYQRYADALSAARTQAADAEALLAALVRDVEQPGIARATAASELARWPSPTSVAVLAEALGDRDPLVRYGAVSGLEPLPAEARWRLASALLGDPVRAVRIAVASLVADVPVSDIQGDQRAALDHATEEDIAAQRLNADQPESQVNLGNLAAKRGQVLDAERAYRTALEIAPDCVSAYVNLADVLRQTGRDDKGGRLLRAGLARLPEAAALYHSLGLLQIRQKNLTAALVSLKRAVDLAPDDARFTYVYAVALESAGREEEALAVIDAGLRHAPGDRTLHELRSRLRPGSTR